MNWKNIIIKILVFSDVVFLSKILRKPKPNCGDDSYNCE